MRRRKDEFTSPSSTPSPHDNAFTPQLFEELRQRDFEPAVPEGELPGPWRVTRLWGDGPPLWAVYGLGERGPRVTFDDPGVADLAYLAAAALALAERPPRFRFQAGADGRLHLMHDGAGVATVHSPELEQMVALSVRLIDILKTAISLGSELPRSRVLAQAAEELLRLRESQRLRDRLNEVYGGRLSVSA